MYLVYNRRLPAAAAGTRDATIHEIRNYAKIHSLTLTAPTCARAISSPDS